jgi:hypothetical protein
VLGGLVNFDILERDFIEPFGGNIERQADGFFDAFQGIIPLFPSYHEKILFFVASVGIGCPR